MAPKVNFYKLSVFLYQTYKFYMADQQFRNIFSPLLLLREGQFIKPVEGDGGVNIPIKVYTDSKNLHKAANTSALVEDSKLRLDLAILKESILSNDIEEFIHVEGRKMLADCLTKKGASSKLLMRIMKTGRMEDISGKYK